MARRLFTKSDWLARGRSEKQLRWRLKTKQCVRVVHGVYADGPEEPDALTVARASVLAADSFAHGIVAGRLHRLDAVDEHQPIHTRRRGRLVGGALIRRDGVSCTNGLQTMLDLAPLLTDLEWEQALESALFKKLLTLDDLAQMELRRLQGADRIRRVLELRPPGARPTESLLETLMVQLARITDGVPEPTRQVEVFNEFGEFVARVDLAWPELGLFIELDGQQHKGQPVYDANRESRVVAATGWLCARFTWDEVRRNPKTTGRRLARIVEQARRRPLSAA